MFCETKMVDFIDKKNFFGKKMGIHAPGVAPKTSGTVKGKWLWYREREENKSTISQERDIDRQQYLKATDVEKQQRLYLVKTGAIRLQTKEDYSINNVRNRVEVANSGLLNFFLGDGTAVRNTIAYSTYHNEKNPDNFPSGNKFYLDENGFVKEELASQFAGQFDTPKGKKTEVYNREKLQESGFAPLRKAFVVCGLMGFHDFLGNYDNFAFINGKLMITDTGVGSGNTGQHSSYVRAGNTHFDSNVIKDLDSLFENKNALVSEFREHLTIKDVLDGIDELKIKSKEDLKKILDDSFKPIPNPFDKSDPRYNYFMRYNMDLQQHKKGLYQAYSQRIDNLVEFQKILNKFYPNNPEKYHVPSFQALQDMSQKLQYYPQNIYEMYAEAHEKLFALNKRGQLSQDERILQETLQRVLHEYAAKEVDSEKIEIIWEQILELEEKINLSRENLQKLDDFTDELKQRLPTQWQEFLNTPVSNLKATDPAAAHIMVELNAQINQIRSALEHNECTFEEAKSSLVEALKIEPLQERVSTLEEKINLTRGNLQKFDNVVNDLKKSLPKKWQEILNGANPGLNKTDPVVHAMVRLKERINKLNNDLENSKCTFEEAKSSLAEAVKKVIDVANVQQEKTTLGKTRKLLGFTIQIFSSEVSTLLQKFLESKHFLGRESFDKKQGVDLPKIESASSKYRFAVDQMKPHPAPDEDERTSFEQHK